MRLKGWCVFLMVVKMIDPNDLQPLDIKRFEIGGIFYLKTGDKFETCMISDQDIKRDGDRLREQTRKFSKEGRLFVRISNPGKAFC